MNSDQIYLFDKGEIIEKGTYTELMAAKKHFYNLEKGEEMNKDWFRWRIIFNIRHLFDYLIHSLTVPFPLIYRPNSNTVEDK